MLFSRHMGGAGVLVAALATPCLSARADDPPPPHFGSYNDFGGTGLLQTSNGRMAPDGAIGLGTSYVWPYTRYFLTAQVLPWLQGTFRYTDISNRDYGPASTTGQSYKDKSVDLKVRLLKEGPYNPELSVGLRDIGGTGLFSSEYIAMSRRYYDFDFTWGIAWGNAGRRGDMANPLGYLSDRFKSRTTQTTTGNLTADYFTGENVGFFGGIEYHTPIKGLNLKLELDGNDYQLEPQANHFPVRSRFNFGIEYRPVEWIDLSLAYERGNQAMFRIVVHSDSGSGTGIPKLNEPPPPPVTPRPPRPGANAATGSGGPARMAEFDLTAPATESPGMIAQETFSRPGLALQDIETRDDQIVVRFASAPDQQALSDAVGELESRLGYTPGLVFVGAQESAAKAVGRIDAEETAKQGKAVFAALSLYNFNGQRYFVQGKVATLVFSQNAYIKTATAFGRAARVLANHVPDDVEFFHMVLTDNHLPVEEITVPRRSVESAVNGLGSADETWLRTVVSAPELPDPVEGEYAAEFSPSTSLSVMPHLRQSLGGPDAFLLYQIYLEPTFNLEVARGLDFGVSGGVNLINNFDKFNYEAPSNLQRVRTRIRDYMKAKDIWLNTLYGRYQFPIAPEWYGGVATGLFEQMYGGVAGEVLYRPAGARWALGIDVNRVWQRSPERTFGFEDYAVNTGHVSYYQMTPYENVYFILSAGRYLAGDVGVTGQVGRRLDNGIEFGVWATKTNVSAEEFGEGSFDKGLYLTIPMDLFYTTPTRTKSNFPFRPLIRDGGQKVATPLYLFGSTGGFDPTATRDGWREIWK